MGMFDEKVRELAVRLEAIARRLDGAATPRAAEDVRHLASELATLAVPAPRSPPDDAHTSSRS